MSKINRIANFKNIPINNLLHHRQNLKIIDEFSTKEVREPSTFKPPDSIQNFYHKYFSFIPITHKIVIFIHSCNFGNTKILMDLCSLLISTGLIEKVDWVYINNIGIDLNQEILNNLQYKEKFIINNYSSDTRLYELPTIYMVKSFSTFNKGVKILYLHTKGVSRHIDDGKDSKLKLNVKLWVDYMTYFLIEKHEECIKLLDNYYTVGVNLLKNHYSGNFWWGLSDYLSTINGRLYCKYDAEWWVLSNGNLPKYYCMHNTRTVLYGQSYYRNLYAK